MLDAEKTVYYLRKAKKGDKEAAAILLENNSLLIKSIIRRFKNKGVEYDDLYQLGCVGFLKAIKNFDEKFGVVFSTYAVPMILGEVKRFLRDDGSIKVSRIIKSQAAKINRFVEDYSGRNGETPSVEEISAALSIEREDVILALDSSKPSRTAFFCASIFKLQQCAVLRRIDFKIWNFSQKKGGEAISRAICPSRNGPSFAHNLLKWSKIWQYDL